MLPIAGSKYNSIVIFQFGIILITFRTIPTPKKVAPNITESMLAPKNEVQNTHGAVKLSKYTALRSSSLSAGAAFY